MPRGRNGRTPSNPDVSGTAVADPPKARRGRSAEKTYAREFAVRFRNVGIGKSTCRIGVQIRRGETDLDDLDALFVQSLLDCRLECDPNAAKDAEGQQTFDHAASLQLDAIAESPRLGLQGDAYTLSLQFQKSAINIAELARFACMDGALRLTRIGAAQSGASGDDGEDDGDE